MSAASTSSIYIQKKYFAIIQPNQDLNKTNIQIYNNQIIVKLFLTINPFMLHLCKTFSHKFHIIVTRDIY